MDNKFLILIVALFTLYSARAQVLNQDAKGESSIVYPGGSAYFNITESQLGFSYNNLPSTITSKQGWLLGTSLKGESKTGTLNLLKEGEVTPSGKVSLTLGRYDNKLNSKVEIAADDSVKKYSRIRNVALKRFLVDLNITFENHVDGSSLKPTQKADLISKFKKIKLDFKKDTESMKSELEQKFIEAYKAEKDNNVLNLLQQFAAITRDNPKALSYTVIEDKYKDVVSAKSKIDTYRSIGQNERKTYTIHGFSYYIHGGFEATGYQFIDSTGFVNDPFGALSNESFTAGEILVGANFHAKGTWILGIAMGPSWQSNFSSLSSNDFSLKEEVEFSTSTAPDTAYSITKKKDVKAYNTKPVTNRHFSLKVDVAYFIGTENGNVVINPYYRFQTPGNENKNAFATVSDFGLGAYFNNSKGKFQGGLYIQFNDINDNWSKLKMDNSSLNFGERISIGILTKFALGSIFQRLE